ncbi:Rieske 2Fe-2S domain-containing protein [Modestobacter versicolor]|uniref:(2Fe-2S)-binding protein n=1 Tax=Modestobacter versicolor TaxID=429133 RepID=A0A323V8Z1_9ACTN|nr:Rieske 2Fe-2S domain-containing protein [Modestobacter versicolor]MBB3677865.1 nitrite reductase/ring-hydroxylating ferredoxin subunit [Modestobacter versicolor]PZA21307.1 (2Fe-2S)-binding protein [Modestobacter versicolor]
MSLLAVLDRLSEVSSFDKTLESARTAVNKALQPQAFKDLLHGSWLGHPLHPILAMVPVGTWLSAGLLDIAPPTRPAATALITTGVAASLPAALAGAADWSEQDDAVRRLGALHAVSNVAALGLYVGSLVARKKGNGGLGRALAYTGLGVASASASIGGHMSYAQSSGANHSVVDARQLTTDWIDLGPLDDLPDGRPALRTGEGQGAPVPLAVVRRGAKVDAFISACAHVGGPLAEGTVEEVRGSECLVCPWHGSAFDLESGQPRRGPTASAQEKLQVKYEAGRVFGKLPDRHVSK